jgi:type VI secretion system secreted protein Hcp
MSFGGGTPAKAKGEIIVVKHLDTTSPKLFLAAATGKPFQKATIEFAKKKGRKQVVYLKFTMNTVLVSSVESLGHASNTVPSEQVTLNFAKLSEEFLGNSHTTIHLSPHQFAGG